MKACLLSVPLAIFGLAAVGLATSPVDVISAKKRRVAHPEIPSVLALRLPKRAPQAGLQNHPAASPGVSDPILEKARALAVFDDFKPLSDAIPKTSLSAKALKRKASQLGSNKKKLKAYIEANYSFEEELQPVEGLVTPRWKLQSGNAKWDAAFGYTENVWPTLLRQTPKTSKGSLLVSPYPIVIAAPGRFHESYYWDTYFGSKGLIATERLEVAQMQVENFLHSVQNFGLVPNGGRDYYLTRSQPPFLSSMIREVYLATVKESPDDKARAKDWLARRAYPLLKIDYEGFWMRPTRHDAGTGLNHHWDDLDLPRPERHAYDDEKALGRTYRDVRAAAESGLDFTVAFDKQASRVAGVLLNAVLFKVEKDLAWAAGELGLDAERTGYEEKASARAQAMTKYLWNVEAGQFENYNLATGARIGVLSAAAYAPLFARAASEEQARAMRAKLPQLERGGGLMASTVTDSIHQWDGNNGWPPLQVMAIEGLAHYGFAEDAKRLATKWVDTLAKVHDERKAMFERIDVASRDKPGADTKKYPTQLGFFWTNASYVWALTEVLGKKLIPVDGK